MSSDQDNNSRSTAPKPFVFVLMPFDDRFKDIYHIGIKEVCELAGTHCERVDDQPFDGKIIDRIYNQIAKADVIVADMTGRNANVFYETGYAHALNKRTILLTQEVADIPFDLTSFAHIVYGSSLVRLREELTKKILWAVSESKSEGSSEGFPLIFYVDGLALTGQPNIAVQFSSKPPSEALAMGARIPKSLAIKVDVENASQKAYDASRMQVGLVMPRRLATSLAARNTIAIGPNESLVPLTKLETFMPLSWQSLSIAVPMRVANAFEGESFEMRVRVFTERGNREVPFHLAFKHV